MQDTRPSPPGGSGRQPALHQRLEHPLVERHSRARPGPVHAGRVHDHHLEAVARRERQLLGALLGALVGRPLRVVGDPGLAERGARFDESRVADYPKGTAYERSKQRAEELALAARDGLEVVIVNPSGVYGPGPSATVSFDKGMFEPLVKRRLPALPPGGLGLVFTEGVAAGHLLAADKGRDGERYILCDTYMSLRDLAQTVVRVAGRGWVPPTLPVPAARALAAGSEGLSRLIGRPPLLSRGQLYFFRWNAAPDSTKAQTELGWRTTPLEEGIRRTLDDLGL